MGNFHDELLRILRRLHGLFNGVNGGEGCLLNVVALPGGEIAFGDRAVAYGWNPLSLSGVFIYDYAETRFTLAAWGLPANLE